MLHARQTQSTSSKTLLTSPVGVRGPHPDHRSQSTPGSLPALLESGDRGLHSVLMFWSTIGKPLLAGLVGPGTSPTHQTQSTTGQPISRLWVLLEPGVLHSLPPDTAPTENQHHHWPARISTTWEIILRDKPSCTKAYRSDADETREINCTDDRIAWVSRPEENPDLQIGPVAISHDGYYKCTITSPDGTFWHGYHLQVLVPPEVTLFLSRNRTAVCKAVAGKPVARISWTPERDDCDTKEDCLANGTVTVQSTCAWEDLNVTTVTCSVSHLTGNKSLCKKLPSGTITLAQLNIRPIVILIVLILIIVGSFGFLKSIAPGIE
ncbi:cell surface glycoprotein CD200 receptor 1-like [Otolemur garnettii]|uniref:cell surface glycoprotein CD200 receptor 1-like n=1 Tax=Otolemur garnettii TaxID=30611 RepID=UPI000644721D|nr:cell surface glycoprotein CD200 receptor 1-like [Otolemur garnettii]